MMGVSAENIEALKSNHTEINDPKIKGAIDYALKLVNNPNSNSVEDIEKLKALNYSKVEILEIIAMSEMSLRFLAFPFLLPLLDFAAY